METCRISEAGLLCLIETYPEVLEVIPEKCESLTLLELLELPLAAEDLVKVACTLLPEKLAGEFACAVAKSALPCYEQLYPEDERPRKSIEAGRRFADGEITAEELYDATLQAWFAVNEVKKFADIVAREPDNDKSTAVDCGWYAAEAAYHAGMAIKPIRYSAGYHARRAVVTAVDAINLPDYEVYKDFAGLLMFLYVAMEKE